MKNLNKLEQCKELFESIVAETNRTIGNNSLNHLFGLLAAKKLENGSLEPLLSSIKEAKNNKNQTAHALFNKDEQLLETLKPKVAVPNDVWSIAKWAIDN